MIYLNSIKEIKSELMNKIILGTRGSQLALWQSNHVKKLLIAKIPELEVNIKIITTMGDEMQNLPLPKIGAKGLFTKEIEIELLNHTIDLAVHSLKDLPSTLSNGLTYAGSPKREDVRDAFVSLKHSSIADLPQHATIATGSIRRKTLLNSQFKNINFVDLRGNIETRIQKLNKNGWDGIIIASAALHRLDMKDAITEYLNPINFVPAVSQGAIGIEIAKCRNDIQDIIFDISHLVTTQCCSAERYFMSILGGGCSLPIGCWGRVENKGFKLTGYISSSDGMQVIRETITGKLEDYIDLAKTLAHTFIDKGARKILKT